MSTPSSKTCDALLLSLIDKCWAAEVTEVLASDQHRMRFLLAASGPNENGIVYRNDAMSYKEMNALAKELNELLKRPAPAIRSIRAVLAEIHGFINVSTVCWRGHFEMVERKVPDYENDLNALAEIEAKLDRLQRLRYANLLWKYCADNQLDAYDYAISTPAAQRAKALVEVFAKETL